MAEIAQNLDDDSKHFWGISLTLHYSDNETERHDLPFNEFIHQWQYASMAVVPKRSEETISYAVIRLCYYNNANSAFFDCISLTEEPCQTYTYNDKGDVVSVKSTGNGDETYTYNGTQDLASMITPGKVKYEYTYNTNTDVNKNTNKHLPVKVINDNVYMGIEYDKYGQSIKTTFQHSTDTSVKKMESSAAYSNGLMTSQTDNTGQTTSYAYNGERDLVAVTNAKNITIESHKDPVWDRLDRTYQSGFRSINYGYLRGNLINIKRGGYLSNEDRDVKYIQDYRFSYDDFGNMKSAGVSAGYESGSNMGSTLVRNLVTYSYLPGNGNLQKMTYGPENSPLAKVEYTYDKLSRVNTEKHTNSNPQTTTTYGYNYSSDGNLAGITVNGALGYTYEYDSLGRLIYSAKIQNNRPVLYTKHQYDDSDRIESQKWKAGNDEFSKEYSYSEKDGALIQMKINGENLNFTYNKLKQVSKRTSPGLDVSYTYVTQSNKSTNQIYEIRYWKAGLEEYRLPRLTYSYDQLGNIQTIKKNDNLYYSYLYDAQNQLIRELNNSGNGTYSYDTYGNILSKEWTDSTGTREYILGYDRQNSALLDQIDEVTFIKNSGTPVTKELIYDIIGNPTSYYNGDAEWTFTWQNGKQLAAAQKIGSNVEIANTYDVDGIRDSKTVSGVKHTYTTLSGKIIRESYGTKTIDYIYDNQGKPYKLIIKENGSSNGIVGYYALNLQGDVIAIIDSDGEVAVSYEYDAWSREVSKATGGDDGSTLYNNNRLKYRGYYYDSDLGMYYLGARFYDPALGRFVNADGVDVIRATSDSLEEKNLYSYCNNNPICYEDSTGAVAETVFDIVTLGFSIAEVVANPYDIKAWAGLAGDAIDLIPIVTGVGETIRGLRFVDKAGNTLEIAKAVDFTDSAADTISKLEKVGDFTKSTRAAGIKIHSGYKTGDGFVKAFKEYSEGGARFDYYDGSTIFELKPYNLRNVRAGLKQLQRYNQLLGSGKIMRLEFY